MSNISKKCKQLFTNNSALKLGALVFGYSFWALLAQQQPTSVTAKVPISYYQAEPVYAVTGTDKVQLTVQGTRCAIRNADLATVAAHIDISEFPQEGTLVLPIYDEHFFLPNCVDVLHYTPATATIILKKINNE